MSSDFCGSLYIVCYDLVCLYHHSKTGFFFLKELDDKSLLLDSCKQLIFCILPARNVINRSARLMGSYAMTLDEQFTAFQRVSVLSSSASGSPISDKV